MLTNEQISEYQRIYKKTFGKSISKKDALEQGTKLIRLVTVVYKNLPNVRKGKITKDS